jgi:D-glycero-D-manno-heptose 1,7-bisphosphate phosphatase
VRQAADELSIDLPNSFVVGDKMSDVRLAGNVGATGVLVRTGYGRVAESAPRPGLAADVVKDNLAAAVAWILQQS